MKQIQSKTQERKHFKIILIQHHIGIKKIQLRYEASK